jgi:hypothetical protein
MSSKQTATIILWVLIAVFLAGVVLWSVPRNSNTAADGSSHRSGPNKVLVTINGEPIYADTFDQAFFDMLAKVNSSADLTETLKQRSAVFSNMLQSTVAGQVLRGFGIKNLDRPARVIAREFAESTLGEVRSMTQQQADAAMQQAKTPEEKQTVQSAQSLLEDQLRGFYTQYNVEPPRKLTEAAFLKLYVDVLTNPQYGEAEQFMTFVKKSLVGREIIKRNLPEDMFSETYAKKLATQQVNARWIFIPAEAKKQDDKQQVSTPEYSAETLRAAKEKAQKLHDQIAKDPAKFSELAGKESRHVSHLEDGNLGWISGADPRTGFPAILEYLIFSQKPKELGPVTQITMPNANPMEVLAGQVGYGFVQVIAEPVERQDLGPDFNWETMKDNYISMLKKRYEQSIGEGYLLYMIAKADLKFDSKEIEMYYAAIRHQYTKATRLERETLEQEKDLPPAVIGALSYRVAMSNPDVKGKDRIPLLEAAMAYAGENRWNLHMTLGEAYELNDQKEDAIEQYTFAINAAGGNEEYVRAEVRTRFKRLGYDEGVREIDEWLAEKKKEKEEAAESSTP